jgi:hypothetical protein
MGSRSPLVSLSVVALLFAACDGGSPRPLLPAAPSVPAPAPPQIPSTAWVGSVEVTSVTNPGRIGLWPGQTRAGIEWRVTIASGSILLEQDMANWPSDHLPYAGHLAVRQFSAEYSSGSDYLKYTGQFRGGTLTGTFSEDFTSFEAQETLVWGAPGAETIAQRRWTALRR